jgi:hypothetical protein
VIRGYWFLIPWIDYIRCWDERGAMRTITLTCDEVIMKMISCFSVEMLDYNQKLRTFSSIYNKKYFGEASCKKIELTKRDKFIGVIWLLHKAYSKKMLRNIVCMHIKSSLSWESRVMRLRIDKVPWMNERSIK